MKSHSDTRVFDVQVNDDLSVMLWDVFEQRWRTFDPRCVSDAILASLPQSDRDEIDRAATMLDEDDADRDDCESGRMVREHE